MRIANLNDRRSKTYSSNVYLIRGDYNRIEDVNTLIDVGNDPAVIETLGATSYGLGKSAVEQVLLTHNHFDHAAMLPAVRKAFDPVVCAHRTFRGTDHVLAHGDVLRCGDRTFEVIHTPGHTNDSISLYCQQDGVLFVGDTPVLIIGAEGSYEEGFICALECLCRKEVKAIYFGHGDPLFDDCNARLRYSLKNVSEAMNKVPG